MATLGWRLAAAITIVAFVASLRSVRAADPFEINVVLPLTGNAAFQGKGLQSGLRALEAAVDRSGGINGERLVFSYWDDRSDPVTSVQIVNGLIAKHVAVVLGPGFLAGCRAALPLVKEGPVLYCFSPGLHPDDGSYAFSASVSTNDLIAVSLRYFRDRGVRRIAIITSSDAVGQDAMNAINDELAAMNAQDLVVDREQFNVADVNAAAQIAKIKAAGPQLIVAWSAGAPVGIVFRGLSDAGLDVPVLTTNGNATYVAMQQFAPFLPKALYFPNQASLTPGQITDRSTKAALRTFYAAMDSLGVKPDIVECTPWDPGTIVVDAFRKLGTRATAAQVRAYIANVRGWTGIYGAYDFKAHPQRGLGESAVIMSRWDAAKEAWIAVSGFGGAKL